MRFFWRALIKFSPLKQIVDLKHLPDPHRCRWLIFVSAKCQHLTNVALLCISLCMYEYTYIYVYNINIICTYIYNTYIYILCDYLYIYIYVCVLPAKIWKFQRCAHVWFTGGHRQRLHFMAFLPSPNLAELGKSFWPWSWNLRSWSYHGGCPF